MGKKLNDYIFTSFDGVLQQFAGKDIKVTLDQSPRTLEIKMKTNKATKSVLNVDIVYLGFSLSEESSVFGYANVHFYNYEVYLSTCKDNSKAFNNLAVFLLCKLNGVYGIKTDRNFSIIKDENKGLLGSFEFSYKTVAARDEEEE